jgi:hypothetical protein
MAVMLHEVFGDLPRLLILGSLVLCAGLVLMSYRTDGAHARLQFSFSDPARSLQHLVVWIGVKILSAVLRAVRGRFDLLVETSADVGEWFIERRSAKVQAAVRSRFLV